MAPSTGTGGTRRWSRILGLTVRRSGTAILRTNWPVALMRIGGGPELELFKSSPLAQILVSPEYRIRTEVPVLWGKNQGTAYEGYIDLAAWHSGGRGNGWWSTGKRTASLPIRSPN